MLKFSEALKKLRTSVFGQVLSSSELHLCPRASGQSPELNNFVVVSQFQFSLIKMSVIDKGPQGKPGPTFWSSFHFFVAYLSPLSLWQKPRLVGLFLIFYRKMTRSFLADFMHPDLNPSPSKPRACLLSLVPFDNWALLSWLSSVLSSFHWLVSFDLDWAFGVETPHLVTGRFLSILKVKMTKS